MQLQSAAREPVPLTVGQPTTRRENQVSAGVAQQSKHTGNLQRNKANTGNLQQNKANAGNLQRHKANTSNLAAKQSKHRQLAAKQSLHRNKTTVANSRATTAPRTPTAI
jgi:hypothetical protein